MNLSAFFEPRSIAIIGASRKVGSLGYNFFHNLIQYGYSGKLYPVNPRAEEIDGVPCYPSVNALPEAPDVAVILVPREVAIPTAEACGKKGIKHLILITAGFREVGEEGARLEGELLRILRKYGMRLIGPNCMGIINTDPQVHMNASFSPTEPYPGNVAFISQSGALGVAVLEMARAMRLGFSIFLSEGNKADLKDADFLQYLENHSRTGVLTLYLESIEDVGRFRNICTGLGRKKPIIAVKAGRSSSGARAASSHTGALASPDAATDALFKQCGIIRAQTIQELFEYALAFSHQKLPAGNRVAVMTNAGGPSILATDAIEHFGLTMAYLTEHTRKKLRTFLPDEAAVDNPVDMIASATEETYRQTLETLLQDPQVDAILVIIVRPPVNTTPRLIARQFREVLNPDSSKPVFVVLMAQPDESCGLEIYQELKLPVFPYPESAARSMARMVAYRERLQSPEGRFPKMVVDRARAKAIFAAPEISSSGYLSTLQAFELLKCYGFPVAEVRLAKALQEAEALFRRFTPPVVLKIESTAIVHKSDLGGVKTNIGNTRQLRQAFREIMASAWKVTEPAHIQGVLLQEMVPGDVEVALGMRRDPNYGPIIMFGLGGILVELLKDVSFRIAPLTDRDAREMLAEIRGYPVLKGVRGKAGLDEDILVDALLRLSQLALNFPKIQEMDINPFILAPEAEKCKIVDVRVRLES